MNWTIYGWTVLFAIGLLVSAWNLRECWLDLREANVKNWVGSGVKDAAHFELGNEIIRFCELGGGFLAGLAAWTQVNPRAIVYLLFLIPIGLCINTIRAARFRIAFGHAHKVRRTSG